MEDKTFLTLALQVEGTAGSSGAVGVSHGPAGLSSSLGSSLPVEPAGAYPPSKPACRGLCWSQPFPMGISGPSAFPGACPYCAGSFVHPYRDSSAKEVLTGGRPPPAQCQTVPAVGQGGGRGWCRPVGMRKEARDGGWGNSSEPPRCVNTCPCWASDVQSVTPGC